MTFKASLKEIDNGFLVDLNPKVLEYQEVYVSTFEGAIAAIVASYKQGNPSDPSKEPSEAAIKYAKLAGLLGKAYTGFLTVFLGNYPGQDVQAALEAANCKVVEGKVIFVGA